jgi:hypothetical protein
MSSYFTDSDMKIKGGATVNQIESVSNTEDLNVRECRPGKESSEDICMSESLGTHLVGLVLSKSEQTGKLSVDIKTAIVNTNTENGCSGTDCTSESLAIYNNSNDLSDTEKEKNRKENFLGVGPSGSNLSDRNEWLSNDHIDNNIMRHYSDHWNDKGKKVYKHMNFHMCGFMKTDHEASDSEKRHQKFPTNLGSMDNYNDVVKPGYKYFGCILNVDTYDNGGKHWVALFADIPNKTLEYFDSVGRPPFTDVTSWMEKARYGMPNPSEWKIVSSNRHQHQKKNWDCGLYACFYIIKRVQGVPYTAFHAPNADITDEFMGHDIRKRFFSLKKF